MRAVHYFRSSLDPQQRFVGYTCKTNSWLIDQLANESQCPLRQRTGSDLLGIYTKRVHGGFSLETTGTPPFCVGC